MYFVTTVITDTAVALCPGACVLKDCEHSVLVCYLLSHAQLILSALYSLYMGRVFSNLLNTKFFSDVFLVPQLKLCDSVLPFLRYGLNPLGSQSSLLVWTFVTTKLTTTTISYITLQHYSHITDTVPKFQQIPHIQLTPVPQFLMTLGMCSPIL